MDVIKKKHWWQSDALKWSVLGLLGLLVGYLVVLMYAQRGIPVRHYHADIEFSGAVYFRQS